MDKLSFVLEGYLDAVYELSSEGSGARLTDIAKRMQVTKSTANAAMLSLAEKKLIQNPRYKDVTLTEEGRSIAEQITRKHKTVYRFFTEVLKLPPEVSAADACAIEHVISGNAVIAMQSLLNDK